MRIYDCCMYRGEADMLEFRLTELDDSPVYRHVIVESPVTHRGDPKPLYFMQQMNRFAPWMDRIRYVISSQPTRDEAPGMSPWDREHAQRNAAWLECMKSDDVLLIADLDEIPAPKVLGPNYCSAQWSRWVLMQRAFVNAVDWQYPTIEPCSVLVTAGLAAGGRLAALRDDRLRYEAIDNAGWHFGWLGDHESRLVKLGVTCHLEADVSPVYQDEVRSGRGYREGWHATTKLIPVDVDETWPRYIQERRCPENWFRPRLGGSHGKAVRA